MSLLRDVGRRRRRVRSALTKATATTAIMTASAVLVGTIQGSPVAAAEPEQDTGYYRNSIGTNRRLDRCMAANALHIGGPLMKAKAIEGLTGTEEQLKTVLGDGWIFYSPLKKAAEDDEAAGSTYGNFLQDRDNALSTANQVYAKKDDTGKLAWLAPKFSEGVWNFTIRTQRQLAYRLTEDTLSKASPESLARAKVIAEENHGKDEYHDWAANSMLSDSQVGWSSRTSTDIAAYLKRGGFPTVAPAKDSAEYRVEVEDFKQAWSACDYNNPYDPSRKLNEPLMTAMIEWELEYAGQADQRATIMRAEAEASAATRAATDDLVEAMGQAWLAEQLLIWRKGWLDATAVWPDRPSLPTQAMYDQADRDLARYRANVATQLTEAKAHAAEATAAAQKAVTAQQEAWAVADTNHVPRGRGLTYAQQSVQVARASAAAATAAAKATETALAAANATVATTDALLAKAQTEMQGLDTEFRRVAAEEAAKQAKAAADSAEANATEAATSANAAKAARATAEQKRDKAASAAASAAAERTKAQTEQATAVASRTKAAAERTKAQEAEQRATAQETTATAADTAAGTAAADARTKRTLADQQAKAARTARDKAVAALEVKRATAARAAALEAAAGAAAGSAAAEETRAAATAARTAANQASEAANAAQTTADQATAAAVTARSAATTAEAAAGRAQASASLAWSAYHSSVGAASAARAAAATALDASQDAATRAGNAATASENATELARKAKQEADAAATGAGEAVKSAATVVGRAHAAAQSALAARDAANAAITAAADAVALGSPYQEKDSAAAFAVLAGQSSKTAAEQQAAAADAKAAEAARAAESAQQTAARATGDAKLAAEAAARAATDSARAVAALTRAQTSAAQAADAQKDAKSASDTAAGHADQAGTDAATARTTADEASRVAGEAGREATDAERHAAEANEKAGRASEAADNAGKKATDSEQAAKDAESKASDAAGNSRAAEEAAKKAEQEQREKNEAAHQEALENGSTPIKGGAANWPALGEREEQILRTSCGQACVDDYREGLAAVSVNVVEWATANGGQILFEQLDAAKVKECLSGTDVEDCLWNLVDVPASSVIVGRMPALSQAIERVATGMRKIFRDADDALRRLNELTAVIRDVRSTPRLERCLAGVALHAGGARTKAVAIQGLSGTDAQLHDVIGDVSWLQLMALGQATGQDRTAAYQYADSIAARKALLEDANRPYAMSSFDDGITLHAPQFGAEVMAFTHATQPKLSTRLGWDAHTNPSAEALAKAREITEQNRGKDDWHDFAADSLLRNASTTNNQFFGGTTSADIARYLRHGGFPAKKVTEGTAAFRVEVENLKQAWATCNHADPVDPRNALSEVVSQASAEWEAEYAAQNLPRTIIMRAEADAAAATRAATDNMIEAIGQAWLADQILRWQQYWHQQLQADPDHILKPKQALFDQAKRDLETARGKVRTLLTTAQEQAGLATAASQRAVSAQQDAWAIADAAEVPRGRGLMYAQQSVQVARASGAAATAAAKATETALNAANATVSTSHTLLALAQTQTHAVNTEFRRIAAQEAAAQAKAAADSADAHAAEAEAQLKIAKEARATAEKEEQEAKQAAATAQSQRAVAELERAKAAAARTKAEQERSKAGEAEGRAQTERARAGTALNEATSAGGTAASKRVVAERAEQDAADARDRAAEAERDKRSKESRAAALESAAAAAVGTAAAGETRTAATEARTAANEAGSAATAARTAANDASQAAINARAAATEAKVAAANSQKAADNAWSAYYTAQGSAAVAHAAAATAIDASEAAAMNAKKAEEDSKKASAAAVVAKQEASAAHVEAVRTAQWAAKTAGYAYAVGTAASAARDTATQAVKPATEAIAIGSPYQETDASAGFAVLTGQSALTLSEQQAKAAEAKAVQATAYAAEAQRLAEQAAADDKLAAQAAAAAAKDAERAAKAVQRAQTAAAEAEKAAQAAQAAAKRADGYALQAGADALAAQSAAYAAHGDAVTADREATDAEKDAASARSAADEAEADAGAADRIATVSENDATRAETAAANARESATQADAAADRAEAEERRRQEEEQKRAMASGDKGVLFDPGVPLSAEDQATLFAACGQQCVDDYKAAFAAVSQTVVDWIKANGVDILLELIGVNDLKRCFGEGDVESCLWTLVNVGSLVLVVGKLPAVAKAIAVVVSGVSKFFAKAKWGKTTIERLRKVIENFKKKPEPEKPDKTPDCLSVEAAVKDDKCDEIEVLDGYQGRKRFGSDGRYHLKEGDEEIQIVDPNDPGRTITDIDLVRDGVLWENKTVTARKLTQEQLQKWVDKHVGKKIDGYKDARPLLAGYEGAPIGIRFEDPAILQINPGLKDLVVQRLKELRNIHPGVDIRLDWPS